MADRNEKSARSNTKPHLRESPSQQYTNTHKERIGR